MRCTCRPSSPVRDSCICSYLGAISGHDASRLSLRSHAACAGSCKPERHPAMLLCCIHVSTCPVLQSISILQSFRSSLIREGLLKYPRVFVQPNCNSITGTNVAELQRIVTDLSGEVIQSESKRCLVLKPADLGQIEQLLFTAYTMVCPGSWTCIRPV